MKPTDLKTIRQRAGWTQTQIGTAVGLTRVTIGLMERGDAPIEQRTARAYLLLECLLDLRDKHLEAGEAAASSPRANGLGYVELAASTVDHIEKLLIMMAGDNQNERGQISLPARPPVLFVTTFNP